MTSGIMTSEYRKLIADSVGKKHSSQWYMKRLGLPLTEESKGSAGKPKFLNSPKVIEDLYDATSGEVDKIVSCYEDIDELREAVNPANMDLIRAHTDHMLWKFGSAIWSPAGQLLVAANVGDPDYDRRLVHSNPEDHQMQVIQRPQDDDIRELLTSTDRIRFTLFGWMVHRAYRRLQNNAKKSIDQDSGDSSKAQANRRAMSARSRARPPTSYEMSPDSDILTEGSDTSSASPYVPAERSDADFRKPILQEDRILKRDYPSNTSLHPTSMQTWPQDENGSRTTTGMEDQRADGRTIKRRNTSMPDGFTLRKKVQGRAGGEALADMARSALLQEFKAGVRPRADTIAGGVSRETSYPSPQMAHYDTDCVETVHRFRHDDQQPHRSDNPQQSPFDLNASPPSPGELADEPVASLVHSGGRPHGSEGRQDSDPRRSHHNGSAEASSMSNQNMRVNKGKSNASCSPGE